MAEEKPDEMEITEMKLDEENVARLISESEEKNEREERDREGEQEEEEHEQGGAQQLVEREDLQDMQVHEETATTVGPRLFIGGLNSKTKVQDLREHFEKYGELTECSIAKKNVKGGGKNGKSRGFGFVNMTTMAQTEAVLKDTHVINDKVVTVMISKPPDAPERKLRLCISNLDIEKTTEESLSAHFSQFGTVSACRIAKEQKDGKTVSRGLGFITMATEEDLEAVLNGCVDGRQTVDEKTVEVKRVVSDTQHYDKLRKLWFGGLNKDVTTESDIIDHFSSFGTVQDCVIIRDPPETEGGECKSKGYGYINMASVVETGAILKHSGPHKIHGKELVFNRVPQQSSATGFNFHPVKEIYVSGLQDTTLTVDDLKAYFNTHANVRYVSMVREEGTARILLDNADDAEKLAQMGDHFIQKFWITVKTIDPQSAIFQSEKPDKSKKQAAKLRQNLKNKGVVGNKPNQSRGAGGGQQFQNSRGRGSFRAGFQKSQSPRQARGFGSSGSRAQYHHQPMQGGYGRPGQGGTMDDYYEGDSSSFGPVRGRGFSQGARRGQVQGRGGANSGGWVFVENLYRESEQKPYSKQRLPKASKGKGRGSAVRQGGSYGNMGGGRFSYADGLGGGYGDEWGEGSSSTRGRVWPY